MHAEESWAETALASYWVIKPSPWWIGLSQKWRGRPRKFVVEEHMGSKVRTGHAMMIDNGPQGVLWVRGVFSRKDKSNLTPYFKVALQKYSYKQSKFTCLGVFSSMDNNLPNLFSCIS